MRKHNNYYRPIETVLAASPGDRAVFQSQPNENKNHWLLGNVGVENISYSHKVSRPQDIVPANQQHSAVQKLV